MSIEERIYSEAFEDGVNYAIQRMFGDDEEKKPKKWPYVVGGTAGGIVGGAIGTGAGMISAGNSIVKKVKDTNKALYDEVQRAPTWEKLSKKTQEKMSKYAEEAGTSMLKRGAVGGLIGAGIPAATAIALYHRKKKELNKKDRD
jgi:hypothetical protein